MEKKSRKGLIIGVIVIAVIGIVATYLVFWGEAPGKTTPGEEKPVTSGTIQVPEGPKIKVVHVDFPKELELTWEKLGMDDFQLNLIGTAKNISNQTIRFDKLIFLLDGDEIGHWPRFEGKTLGPAEEARFNMGMVGYSKTSEVLEVKVVNFQTIGASTPSTPEEPITPESTTTPEPTIKPIMDPEEVAMEWYNLMRKGKFSEVIKLYTPSAQQAIESLGGIRTLEEAWQENTVTKIEIENRTEIKTSEAWVYALFDYADGTTGDRVSFHFKKINGQWRITEGVIEEL